MSRLVKLPSGEYVNVDESVTPQRLQQIMAQNPPKSGPARRAPLAPVNTEQAEVSRRVARRADTSGIGGSIFNSGAFKAARSFANGVTSSFMDEATGAARAATVGAYNAVTKGDASEIGKEYRIARDVVRQEDKSIAGEGGFGNTAAEIAGALVSPVGKIAGGVKAGAAALGVGKAINATRAGAKVASVASRAAKPVLMRGVLAGAGQGALNAAGQDESGTVGGLVGNAVNGATIGGVAGGVLGTAMNGAQKVAQVVRDRAPAAAERTAYGRIAELLSKGNRPAGSDPSVPRMPITPQSAERQLAVAQGRGTDMRVADLTPGLQAQAAKVARRPDLANSNALIETAEGRMAGRSQEFEDQVAGRITPKTGTDAVAFQARNTGARKAAGQRDYDGVLDKPIAWTPELDKFVTKPNPLVQNGIKEAERLMRSQDIDPRNLGLVFGPDGVLQRVERPTMRTFDYLKRGLDSVTRAAKDAKDFDGARIAGEQVDMLRKELTKVNPEYGKVLATQRSYFQQDTAAELGKTVVSRLRGAKADPRQLLDDIKKVNDNDRDALRTGFADALMSLRDTNTSGKGPIAVLQAMTRSPNQRKVLENLFEGKANLGRFERWLARELKASKTDSMVAGPQSITSLVQGADLMPQGVAGAAMNTLRGGVGGGLTGALAAGARSMQDLAKGTGPEANEQIARILMGQGEGLATGVGAATTFSAARKAANAKRVIRAARAGQQPFTSALGDE